MKRNTKEKSEKETAFNASTRAFYFLKSLDIRQRSISIQDIQNRIICWSENECYSSLKNLPNLKKNRFKY